jgi:hypothetical protein
MYVSDKKLLHREWLDVLEISRLRLIRQTGQSAANGIEFTSPCAASRAAHTNASLCVVDSISYMLIYARRSK